MSDEPGWRKLLPAFSLRTLLEVVFVCGVVFYLWFIRPPSNIIQPGHVLEIDVFGVPSSWQPITGLYHVDPDGCVNLGAYYGKLQVARMTADEAQAALLAHLQKHFTGTGARATVSIAGWRNSTDGGQVEVLRKEIEALKAEIGKSR